MATRHDPLSLYASRHARALRAAMLVVDDDALTYVEKRVQGEDPPFRFSTALGARRYYGYTLVVETDGRKVDMHLAAGADAARRRLRGLIESGDRALAPPPTPELEA